MVAMAAGELRRLHGALIKGTPLPGKMAVDLPGLRRLSPNCKLHVLRGDYRLADDLLNLRLGEGGLGVFDFGAALAATSAFAAGQLKRHSRPEEA
jgi:hypothetical protein